MEARRAGKIEKRGSKPDSVQRLLDAALTLFAERGYHATGTRDIAARVGLSPGGLYMHYQSKAQILYVIIRSAHEELVMTMKNASSGAESPLERLKALVRAHVMFHAHHVTVARVANHELGSLPPKHRRTIVEYRSEIEELVQSTLEQGMRTGEFEMQDVRAACFAILSMGIGVARWWKPSGRWKAEELADVYADLACRMVKPA